jgi:hypothetical protein
MKEYNRNKKVNDNEISKGKLTNKKVKKPFVIDQRSYITENSFQYRYGKPLGWTEWIKINSYETDKQRDEAYETLMKKVNNADGIWRRIYESYEYRKRDLE